MDDGGAIEAYGADTNHLRVIPYGANISHNLIPKNIESVIEKRDKARCNILFTGGDWERKGGKIAIRVLDELNRSGLLATLHVVGNLRNVPDGDNIIKHGFLDKTEPSGARKYIELLAKSHFLLLPTMADCTPMVFAEANAFGVPVVSCDTGGTSSIITSGVNGALFSVGDHRAMSEFILNIYSTQGRYLELCIGAKSEYSKRLNWDTSVESLIAEINSVIYG